jgi:uncharacterized protein YegP (UPF0339 family)
MTEKFVIQHSWNGQFHFVVKASNLVDETA